MTIQENILLYIKQSPGATDTEIENHLKKRHQSINQACRDLAKNGYVIRKRNLEKDNNIGNYPTDKIYTSKHQNSISTENTNPLHEEDIKHVLANYLVSNGWDIKVAWGHQQGIDIDAERGNERWVIEVKGPGSRPAMRNNYFVSILGEILQRMDDDQAKYSIALPDMLKYRRLWNELPQLAKERTTIDLILVDENGNISFEK